GLWAGTAMKTVYVISIIIGAIGGATTLWTFLDIMLFMILVPNILAIVLMSPKIIELKNEYFKSDHYYKKDIREEKELKAGKWSEARHQMFWYRASLWLYLPMPQIPQKHR